MTPSSLHSLIIIFLVTLQDEGVMEGRGEDETRRGG